MSDAGGVAVAKHRILVVAIGNPDRGDDGAGALVAARLADRLPANAALLVRHGDILSVVEECAGFEALICVDAAAPMTAPGRIHRLEANDGELPRGVSVTSSHAMGLAEALALARTLGSLPASVTVYAIEGACFDSGAPLTSQVAAAADEVADRIVAEIRRLA